MIGFKLAATGVVLFYAAALFAKIAGKDASTPTKIFGLSMAAVGLLLIFFGLLVAVWTT